MDNIIYLWKIHAISKKNTSNLNEVVYKIVWSKIGTDKDGFKGTHKTSTELVLPNNQDYFVSYEELTEEIIIDWIKNTVNQEQVNYNIYNEIQNSKSFPVEVLDGNFPWQKQPIIEEPLIYEEPQEPQEPQELPNSEVIEETPIFVPNDRQNFRAESQLKNFLLNHPDVLNYLKTFSEEKLNNLEK